LAIPLSFNNRGTAILAVIRGTAILAVIRDMSILPMISKFTPTADYTPRRPLGPVHRDPTPQRNRINQ
jgi:hypothetical protein